MGVPMESATSLDMSRRVPAFSWLGRLTSWPLSPREIRKLSASVAAPPPREIREGALVDDRALHGAASRSQPPALATIARPAKHVAAVMERTWVMEVTYPVETVWFTPRAAGDTKIRSRIRV